MVNFIKNIKEGYLRRKEYREAISALKAFELEYLKENPDVEKRYSVATHFLDEANKVMSHGTEVDTRYNTPKGKPKVSTNVINQTIDNNEIYSRAKEMILKAQQEQVGYGLEKYPEPLNKDTWSVIETIDHSISEKVDDLHYTMMLKIKLEDEERGADIDGEPHFLKHESTIKHERGY